MFGLPTTLSFAAKGNGKGAPFSTARQQDRQAETGVHSFSCIAKLGLTGLTDNDSYHEGFPPS